ncbi:hypothetical protein IV417_04215 [Alphaproteobacteria bacterium KMM 3653]|uniref:Uncharacterized protein n=1 Tax=Harenicola maris TaxID=2841044 RepID=A0AAP2G7J9_9RHOB|nr:hypothetical protein [Harenicola maris]
MEEDFAVLDFALVELPPLAVAEAFQRARQGGFQPKVEDEPAPKKGLLARLFGGGSKPKVPAIQMPGLAVLPEGSLPEGPITRLVLGDMGFGEDKDPLRLSHPIGTPARTLIEFRNHVETGPSEMLMKVSAALGAVEMIVFRYSGTRHPGADFGFAVYRDGALVRMRASRSPEGMEDDAEWSAVDHGAPHILESGLPDPDGLSAADVMTPEMQGDIMEALGIAPDRMFLPDAGYQTQLILGIGAGQPLDEYIESGAGVISATMAQVQAGADEADNEADNEGWEEEITTLLVTAVEDALPPEDHVPWLNDLTLQLEEGDVEGAMIKARALINQGGRPMAEREANVARLEQLFAIRGA